MFRDSIPEADYLEGNMADDEVKPPTTDSTAVRPQFGNRRLENASDIFQHNAWDDVSWDSEQELAAVEKVKLNSETLVTTELKEKYEAEAGKFWSEFYDQHQNRFFKDRNWLFTEFPELATSNTNETCNDADYKSDSAKMAYPGDRSTTRIFEVGCGVGNTVYPILQANNDPGLFVYCCDFATSAVQLVKDNPNYESGRCHPFVCDVSEADPSQMPFPEKSLDFVVMIFVLSAISPEKMQQTIDFLVKFLKPGGKFLFRDYGRYDMAQLRFKNGRCISDHFYVRGDGTRVYFFTQDELRKFFETAGLIEEQNIVDRRLQVNRGRQLKMYRVWIQCKYSKPKICE